jgi:hypothetical protein
MLADLDLLLTAVSCTADDLLPEGPKNARRSVTDAEVATLCVAQAVMGDREFLAIAARRLAPLFPRLPLQPGFHKRRGRLTETIEWLTGVFAADCPGHSDPVVLLDSTPVGWYCRAGPSPGLPPERGINQLAVVPRHVVHPGLLEGWGC